MRLTRRAFNGLFAIGPLALAGCDSGDGEKQKPKPVLSSLRPSTRPAGPRYLALGDSYTVGQGVAPEQAWPVRLAARLRAAGAEVADPEIIARTGWRGTDVHFALDRAQPQGPYAMVSLLIGVNNLYQGGDAEAFRSQFMGLLRRSQGLCGNDPRRVLVLSIPDYGVTPSVPASEKARVAKGIDAFNALIEESVKEVGARLVDVTAISREAAGQPDLVAADGLHPSAKMYERWVDLALPVAQEILGIPAGSVPEGPPGAPPPAPVPRAAPVPGANAAPGKPGG